MDQGGLRGVSVWYVGVSVWYVGGTVGELVSQTCNKTAIAPTVRSAGPFGGRLAAILQPSGSHSGVLLGVVEAKFACFVGEIHTPLDELH